MTLAAAEAGEAAALATVKALRFGPRALGWAEAAAAMGPGVTEKRVRGVLRRDSVKIPLVRDAEPLEARSSGACSGAAAAHTRAYALSSRALRSRSHCAAPPPAPPAPR